MYNYVFNLLLLLLLIKGLFLIRKNEVLNKTNVKNIVYLNFFKLIKILIIILIKK